MTTFYKRLGETKKRIKWEIVDDQIRGTFKGVKNSNKCFCPLTAVHYCETGEYINNYRVQQTKHEDALPDSMRKTIKLRGRHRDRIIAAADNDYYIDYDYKAHQPTNVRRKMIQVLGCKD